MGAVSVGMFSQEKFSTKKFFYENIQQPLPTQTERGGFLNVIHQRSKNRYYHQVPSK